MESEDESQNISNNNSIPDRFQQTGHVHVPVEFDGLPRKYVFALVPSFSLHFFSAAVEHLRIAESLYRKPYL